MAAEGDADDRAVVVPGLAGRVPSDAGQRGPQAGGELAVAGIDGGGPEVVEDGQGSLVADRGEPADGAVEPRRRGRQVHRGPEEALRRDAARPPARADR